MFPLLGGAIRSVTAPSTSDIPVILVAVAECDVLAASLVFAATIRVGIISRRACCRRCGCCVPWFAEAGERVRVATVFFFVDALPFFLHPLTGRSSRRRFNVRFSRVRRLKRAT